MTSQAEAALGRALRLVPVHPSVGAAAGLDVDLSAGSEVRGAEAVAQALTLAMVTLRGSDLFDLRFGFAGLAALAGEADPLLRRERLRLAVIDVLRAEPRIRRIVSVRLGGAEDGPPHRDPGSRVLEVLAEFETVAGTRQAAILNGEVADVR
ncbi:hypothetical protein [Sabulicella rubraurantiaca]|uniref:hypothetical protein n=1 Tax=Sabulicella rubraurantiaca TaxID=2811429 RepID=UPI001A977553|nr:hypothetical protein [Sabulicella rubraurantiaca]